MSSSNLFLNYISCSLSENYNFMKQLLDSSFLSSLFSYISYIGSMNLSMSGSLNAWTIRTSLCCPTIFNLLSFLKALLTHLICLALFLKTKTYIGKSLNYSKDTEPSIKGSSWLSLKFWTFCFKSWLKSDLISTLSSLTLTRSGLMPTSF